jgi:hypothetical protein
MDVGEGRLRGNLRIAFVLGGFGSLGEPEF